MSKNNHPNIQLAHKLLREGKLEQAAHNCRQIILVDPANAEACYLLGIIAEMNGNYESAIQMLKKAIKIQPDTAKYHYSIGITFNRNDMLKEAVEAYLKAVNLNPAFAEAYNNLGDGLVKMGRFDEASKYFHKALEIKPDMAPMVYLNLGNLYQKNKDPEKAISYYNKALSLRPDYAKVYYNLGDLYRENNELEKAISYYNKALSLKPDYAEVYNTLGNLYQENREQEKAISYYNKALSLNPGYAEVYNGLGYLHREINDPVKAISYYNHALSLKPDFAEVYNGLGILYQDKQELGKAISYYNKALSLKPDFAEAYYNLAKITNRAFNKSYYSSSHRDIVKIRQMLDLPNLPVKDKILFHFALGEMYDNCGLYDSAFEQYQKGNLSNRRLLRFSSKQFADYIEQILNTFKRGFWDQRKSKSTSSITPIFIVGLSRSGKSMSERLISSHKKIFGAGETTVISKLITQTLPKMINTTEKFPIYANNIDDSSLIKIAHEYEKYLCSLTGWDSHEYIVDTMPANYQFLGMIALMFPRAKIIFCRRDTLDNCLGIYFRLFTRGHKYAYDLEEIGFYYGQYLKLMDYWKNILPFSIYEIQYENLVRAPEETAHNLMAYLNLEWNRDCEEASIEFFQDKNTKGTSQKFISNHPRGIGWSSNYNKYLGPLQKSLQKHII